MTAMQGLMDYLRKSPSMVYPAEVLEYAIPAEAECVWLRELVSEHMHANERLLTELKRYKGIVRARYQDPVIHLVNENARLRDLCRDMWPHVRHRTRMCVSCELGDECAKSDEPCLLYGPMERRMRELGVLGADE